MPGKIFLKYDYYHGGLGDFVRGALATYAFCKSRNLEFHIYIPSHPLRHCFDLPLVQPETSTEFDYDIGNTRGALLLERIFDTNPSEEIILLTNAYEFVDDAEIRVAALTFREILRPSSPVLTRVEKIYSALNVRANNYVSLHMRCGDAFMTDYDRYCPGDMRCEPNAALIKVKAAIDTIRYSTSMPILFHTDNYWLREKVAALDCITLSTAIQHTAQHAQNVEDYYDTVAEFYLLGGATTIYYIVPSGFPRWAATIFERPLVNLSSS